MRFRILIALILLIVLSIVGGLLWFVNSTWKNITDDTQSHTTPPQSEWAFAVMGDTEDMHGVTQRMLDDLKNQPLDFIVHLGDVSSTGDPEKMKEVRDAFSALPFPTYYVVGNNDLVYDDATETRTSSVFEEALEQTPNFAIEHHNAHILLLDNSNRRIGFSDATLTWLTDQLTHNASYTFLFYHRPLHLPLEDIFGDDETTYSREQNEKFLSLITQYPITHIFNGHIHTYLSYTLQGIPDTVSGGGGAYPQAILGGESAAYFHYVIVHVPNDGIGDPWIEVKKFE